MLPGLRFLFSTIVLSFSLVIFGVGATALLRAAHEGFASNPPWRSSPPEQKFARPVDRTEVLASLRAEPAAEAILRPGSEPVPQAAAVPTAAPERLPDPALATDAASQPAAAERSIQPAAPDVTPPLSAAESSSGAAPPSAVNTSAGSGSPAPVPAMLPPPTEVKPASAEATAVEQKIATTEPAASSAAAPAVAAPVQSEVTPAEPQAEMDAKRASADPDPLTSMIAALADPPVNAQVHDKVHDKPHDRAKSKKRAEKAEHKAEKADKKSEKDEKKKAAAHVKKRRRVVRRTPVQPAMQQQFNPFAVQQPSSGFGPTTSGFGTTTPGFGTTATRQH